MLVKGNGLLFLIIFVVCCVVVFGCFNFGGLLCYWFLLRARECECAYCCCAYGEQCVD